MTISMDFNMKEWSKLFWRLTWLKPGKRLVVKTPKETIIFNAK